MACRPPWWAGPGQAVIRARASITGLRVASAPRTAFIATHYNVDFSEHYLASFLAERGYGFLGWNTRFRGNEAHFLLDHALAEIGVGVRWLREQAGVERIVLLGQLGRRIADGGLSVAGGRAERDAGRRDAAAAGDRGPAGRRPVHRAGGPLRSA